MYTDYSLSPWRGSSPGGPSHTDLCVWNNVLDPVSPQDNMWTSTDGGVQLENRQMNGRNGRQSSDSLSPRGQTANLRVEAQNQRLSSGGEMIGKKRRRTCRRKVSVICCRDTVKEERVELDTACSHITSTVCINISVCCLILQVQTSHKAIALPSAKTEKMRRNEKVLKYSNPLGYRERGRAAAWLKRITFIHSRF